jgi:xanthine dehydrogenase accessory factor
MLDIAAELSDWCARRAPRPFAVATVVAVAGSAPRRPGAALAVDGDGAVVGSVSGGCVEGAVYELCRQVLESGEPALSRFGCSDEDAYAVGLTCGGVIDVFVQRIDPGADEHTVSALSAAASGVAVAVARVIEGPAALLGGSLTIRQGAAGRGTRPAEPGGTLGDRERDRAAVAATRALLDAGHTAALTVGCGDDRLTLLVESRTPPPRMLVFGAVDYAAAVARIGKFLGYRVTLCDARPVFATAARFPDADEVVVDWPHRYLDSQRDAVDGRTVMCVLTHDAKFDVPLLERALRMPVGYVGAMGSRRTHQDRLARLRKTGLTESELARLRSPIGLDLGGHTPEETAVSIAAEIVAGRNGGSGLPLTGAHAPIHKIA